MIIFFYFLTAIVLRLLYLITPQLNSDHAVIGLAARHILKGEFPIFFYGFPFEGIIEGYIAAPLFWLFGSSRFVLDCVPALMALLLIYTVYKLAQTIFGNNTARLALLFSSIAPPYFLIMTTVPMNGYIETAILGATAFIITYKIIYSKKKTYGNFFLLGLVIGFAFYLHFHIIPFFITTAVLLFVHDKKIIFKKYILFSILGFLIGSFPLILYNVTNNFETFHEIGKGIENSTPSGTLKHLLVRGYWNILGISYIPYLCGLAYLIFRRKKGSEILILFIFIFPFTYWLSGRGEINTNRYLIPLYSITPIVLAYFLNVIKEKNKSFFIVLVILILGSNLYTNLKSITIFYPNELKNYRAELALEKELYKFLKSKDIKGAYALSWWIGLKLNFDFKEDIIFSLIYEKPYLKYQKLVDKEKKPAILAYFSEFAPTLDSIGGTYKTHAIPNQTGNFHPYSIEYDLTPENKILEEIDNTNWIASSSYNTKTASLSFDRDIATRWHSDTAQKKDMDFTIDLGKTYNNVTRLTYHPGPETDWPCGYELYVSTAGDNYTCIAKNPAFITPVFWDGPHPFIRSINGLIEIDFPPQQVRYLKLILTKDKERFYWSIAELYIYRKKTEAVQDWDTEKIVERILNIKPKKVFADPWLTSHIDSRFYTQRAQKETIDNNYIYKHFMVSPFKLKDYAFIVLEENYPAFLAHRRSLNAQINTENFGPYKLITFKENTNIPYKLYWDGFHLLKCTY